VVAETLKVPRFKATGGIHPYRIGRLRRDRSGNPGEQTQRADLSEFHGRNWIQGFFDGLYVLPSHCLYVLEFVSFGVDSHISVDMVRRT
jgi:hypothetical protein